MRRSLMFAVVMLLTTAVIAPIRVADAQTALPSPVSHIARPDAFHCVSGTYSSEAVQTLAAPQTSLRQDCFRSLSDAIAFATGDARFRTMSDDQVADLEGLRGVAAELRARRVMPAICGNCRGYTLGTDYQGSHWTSKSPTLTWYNAAPCRRGTTFWSGSMSKAWNDVISSAHEILSDNCSHWYHYHDGGYLGSVIDCGLESAGCYEMGSMDNRTSSEKWVG